MIFLLLCLFVSDEPTTTMDVDNYAYLLRHCRSCHGPGTKVPIFKFDGQFLARDKETMKWIMKELDVILRIGVSDFGYPNNKPELLEDMRRADKIWKQNEGIK